MIWNSAGDFFAMGGYALYVWGSVIVVFGSMAGELLFLRLRGKSIREQLINAGANSLSRTGRKQ